jgi:hypothetical protein
MNDIHDTLGRSLVRPIISIIYFFNGVVSVAFKSPTLSIGSTSVRPPAQNQEQQPEANPSTSPTAPALNDLQAQLHDTQSSLANHVYKVRTLEGVIAEHDAIKREIGLLRLLVKKSTHRRRDRDQEHEHEEFGAGLGARGDDDDSRSIRTIVPHELERRMRRGELGGSSLVDRTPEPMGLDMTLLSADEEP